MKVKNISDGPRGAYFEGELRFAKVGEVIEADDFPEEWFEPVEDEAKPAKGKKAAASAEQPVEEKAEGETDGA